jgi:ABC-2 type transport system ATP-binding protein
MRDDPIAASRSSATTPAAPLLIAEDLRYAYPGQPAPALDGIDLVLRPGHAVGLLGPNGSGKSTLIHVLLGLSRPQSGQVRSPGGVAPTIAWVPQDFAFYPQLTCRENLRFFAGMLALPRGEPSVRVDEAITACALAEFADRPAQTCSGGVRRRLNIAVALLVRPQLLLLDEPTVGVDPQTRGFLLEQVRALVRRGTAVLYATHYMEEVEAACDRILLIDRGRVLAQGPLQDLLHGEGGAPAFDSLEALFMHHTRRSLRD